MPTSIREQLLAAISTAVGGVYDLPIPADESELPWVSVKDIQEEASDDDYGHTTIVLEVVIGKGAAAVSRDREALRAQGNELLASVIEDMGADETFGSLAEKCSYAGGVIQAELGAMCLVAATFNVTYSTVRGDPYTIV